MGQLPWHLAISDSIFYCNDCWGEGMFWDLEVEGRGATEYLIRQRTTATTNSCLV